MMLVDVGFAEIEKSPVEETTSVTVAECDREPLDPSMTIE